jgi:hypothetical protein
MGLKYPDPESSNLKEDPDGKPYGGWKGVDLDCTLAEYHGFSPHYEVGGPIPRMVARVKQWLSEGIEVRIVTARVGPLAYEQEKARELIEAWCEEHIGVRLPVTHEKDYQMWELWDDRVVQVERNTGRRVDGLEEECPTVSESLMEEVGLLNEHLTFGIEEMTATHEEEDSSLLEAARRGVLRNQIEEVAKYNVCVNHALQAHRQGQCTFDEAMMISVLSFCKVVDHLVESEASSKALECSDSECRNRKLKEVQVIK